MLEVSSYTVDITYDGDDVFDVVHQPCLSRLQRNPLKQRRSSMRRSHKSIHDLPRHLRCLIISCLPICNWGRGGGDVMLGYRIEVLITHHNQDAHLAGCFLQATPRIARCTTQKRSSRSERGMKSKYPLSLRVR
jgi:hypothetical protein